jgi:hypothetical protein
VLELAIPLQITSVEVSPLRSKRVGVGYPTTDYFGLGCMFGSRF